MPSIEQNMKHASEIIEENGPPEPERGQLSPNPYMSAELLRRKTIESIAIFMAIVNMRATDQSGAQVRLMDRLRKQIIETRKILTPMDLLDLDRCYGKICDLCKIDPIYIDYRK